MRNSLTPKKLVAAVSVLAVLAVAWTFAAPAAIGGSATYVVTDGVSMQPRFHAGDLAIVRHESSYHVGEIVAYRSRMLHTIVLHRIVGMSGGRYRFKGDNNGFVDTEHPTQSQLVGALWVHVPGIGSRAGLLRRPGSVALAALFGLLLFASTLFTTHRRQRDRHRATRGIRFPRLPSRAPSAPVVAFALAVVLFGGLAALAFGHAGRGPTPTSVRYEQTGTFSYSADAVRGAAYPSGRATTGDPLFLRLVHDADVGFSYRFVSSAGHRVQGVAGLVATVASTNGWKRTIVLAAPHAFDGDRVTIHGAIDLTALGALLVHLESTTQVAGSYTVTLTPRVKAHGSVSGEHVTTAFSPALAFSLDSTELEPVLPGAVGHPGLPNPSNPLRPASSGSVAASRMGSLGLSFAGRRMSVAAARVASLVGLIAALCLLVGFSVGDLLGDRMHTTEAESILARYRSLLVQVAHVRDPSTQRVVVVSDMSALVRIAERYDRMILHERVAGRESYFVAEDGVLYRYEAEASRPTLVSDRPAAEAG